MMPVLAVLLHDDGMDIIYFWSSIVIVLLPLAIFTWLTWVLVKAYRKEQGARSTEQKAPN
jgi:ACR3 family arsenite efflux pump ArsB